MIKEEFIRHWETGQENSLAMEYGGYIYVPYIMAHAVASMESGINVMDRIVNDSRWAIVNLGNTDGVGVPSVE